MGGKPLAMTVWSKLDDARRLGAKVKHRLERRLKVRSPDEHPSAAAVVLDEPESADLDRHSDPPVVARMVVEIRSDGTRTIARGAMEDARTGEQVAIEARGSTPLALAGSLARSLASMPLLAARAGRAGSKSSE